MAIFLLLLGLWLITRLVGLMTKAQVSLTMMRYHLMEHEFQVLEYMRRQQQREPPTPPRPPGERQGRVIRGGKIAAAVVVALVALTPTAVAQDKLSADPTGRFIRCIHPLATRLPDPSYASWLARFNKQSGDISGELLKPCSYQAVATLNRCSTQHPDWSADNCVAMMQVATMATVAAVFCKQRSDTYACQKAADGMNALNSPSGPSALEALGALHQ